MTSSSLLLCLEIIYNTSHNRASHDCGLWRQSVAMAAYMVLET